MDLNPEFLQQLVITFKSELEEATQIITNELLKLEKEKLTEEQREKIIGVVFRAAHNIKGSSRSLNIKNVGVIAHHIESLFSSIQKKIITITSQHIDLCLEAVDNMQLAMQSFIDKTTLPFDIEDLIARLEKGESLAKETMPSSSTWTKSTEQNASEQQASLTPKTEVSTPPQATTLQEQVTHPDTDEIMTKVKAGQKDTIRVSIDNIDHVSALMEEMQVNKIAITDHYSELMKLALKTKNFAEIWQQILYFMKGAVGKGGGENLQKLFDKGEDYFTDITNSTLYLQKNMRARINEFSTLSDSLQDEIRMLRLVPMSNLLCTMPRYARDLGRQLNKKVDFHIIGDEVRIDKMVLERLKDPIIHLLRNSIDHGIESSEERQAKHKNDVGQINIHIKEENSQIFISLFDDGAGIDIKKIVEIAENKNMVTKSELEKMNEQEKLDLIFRPGFSTKEIITEVSGRGVGLDVVKANLSNLNGQVSVQTELNKGTTFSLRVPLTLSSERGLLITSCGQLFVIPTSAVQRVLIIRAEDIFVVEGSQAIMVDNYPVPLLSLTDILGLEQQEIPTQDKLHIMVVKKGWNAVAILIDNIIGEREIVIKLLQPPLTNVLCVAGGTLSGSNQVIIVINPSDLINTALHLGKIRRINLQDESAKTISQPHILVVDDSITTRSLEKNILESKNYQVTVAVNGKEAWDRLQKQTFSLLITDITMPIMDGFTLTEQVKKSEKLRNLPVIIVTSLGSDAEKKRGIEVGADAYIVKSEFESGTLLDIVEQLV